MTPQLPPEGISQSAWDEAREVVADTQGCNCSHCVGTIARAIMAATERAALVVEEQMAGKTGRDRMLLLIAVRAIRRGRNWTDAERVENLVNFLTEESEDAARMGLNDNFQRVPHNGEVS